MDDLLQHFIIEARDLVQQATDDLLALERDPSDAARLDSAFRAVHTLKGSVGLFDFAPLNAALHAAEDLLGALKEQRSSIDTAAIDSLMECIARTEQWVAAIEQTEELPADAPAEGERLAGLLRSRLDSAPVQVSIPKSSSDAEWARALLAASPDAAALLETGDASLVAVRYTPRADCFFAGDDPMALSRSVPDLVALRLSSREPWPPVSEFDPFSCNLVVELLSGAPLDEVKAVFRFVPDQVTFHEMTGTAATVGNEGSVDRASANDGAGARMLRVDARRIDHLADLVGELVIAKNALAHLAAQIDEGMDKKELSQRVAASQATIARLVADMHRGIMDVRMLPLRDIFRRFPRAVRDIAGRLGKQIDFSMQGEGVEADKSVVEGLFEPLLHVIRNAVDHGAEPETERLKSGKSARARVTLRARRDGDMVIIEVEDDGRGIDPERIRQVARERGLAPDHRADALSDAEVRDLIFAPGFSTASQVTDLSGRGVGMDAVRTAVEKMGGRVGIDSALGHGTTIRLSLPLTVVMTKVMTVRAGGELYGIPMDGIVETAFVPSDRIVPVRDARAFVLRDRTLPLIRLTDLLGQGSARTPGRGEKVLVIPVEGDLVGLAVDGFAERMDVLMRPMGGILAGLPGVSGTTLLGDGSILMILDVPELIG
jgi:two-component system, chemotaxis family, sensor kinase CheA